MTPLNLANVEETVTLLRITGSEEERRRLTDLGFVAGEDVRVVAVTGDGVIVRVRDTRVALSAELAAKIYF